METPERRYNFSKASYNKQEGVMKIKGVFVLSILVVLCFGFLMVFNVPAKSATEPQSQNQALVNALNTANHNIDWGTASTLIANKTITLRTGLTANAATAAKAKTVTGGVFARSAFDKILSQPGVIGIRYYYAQTADGTPTLVLAGVNSLGVTMTTGAVEDASYVCPPFCD
jgi:hypothetical protein